MLIEVNTAQVPETTSDLKVNVSTTFTHDLPEVSENVTAQECLDQLVQAHGAGAVYKLVQKQYTIDIQAPARRELIAQWESINAGERAALIQMPTGANGTKGVATATLPEAQRSALQAHMDTWRLGEKPARVRTVRVAGDSIDDTLRRVANGEIVGEELEALRARAAEILGLQAPRRR